jgi:hypothetical protein
MFVLPEALSAPRDRKPFFVFINEGRAKIQIEVVSDDKNDKIVLPLRPEAIEGAVSPGGRGEARLYTSSKDMVSGRLLFTRSLPTPMTAREFFETKTASFYFRVVDHKIILVKPADLTPKERRWLKERTRGGW